MKEELILLNDWWETRSISKEKAKEYKRKLFPKVKDTSFTLTLCQFHIVLFKNRKVYRLFFIRTIMESVFEEWDIYAKKRKFMGLV